MSRYHKPAAQPKKTNWHNADIGLPFPNFALGKSEIPAVCRCIYDGKNFYVTNQLDMHTLHYNGAFGTSSLTFRGLSYDNRSFAQKPYFKKKITNRNLDSVSNGAATRSPFKNFHGGAAKRIRVDVQPSTVGPELCVQISQEPIVNSPSPEAAAMNVDGDIGFSGGGVNKSKNHCDREKNGDGYSHHHQRNPKIDTHLLEEERLILMPEEAIFLSFGVGCLAIYNLQGDSVDYKQCWKNLVTADPNFPTQYAAYHYYRGKNWVPKNGQDYGASYVLYEGGPAVNHATYIVHIIERSKPKPTWLELAAWQRLAAHLSKHLLLCEVSVPTEFRPETSEPRSVFDMKLDEMSLCRWAPRVDAEASD